MCAWLFLNRAEKDLGGLLGEWWHQWEDSVMKWEQIVGTNRNHLAKAFLTIVNHRAPPCALIIEGCLSFTFCVCFIQNAMILSTSVWSELESMFSTKAWLSSLLWTKENQKQLFYSIQKPRINMITGRFK